MHKSMSLKYEPSSEPLHIYVSVAERKVNTLKSMSRKYEPSLQVDPEARPSANELLSNPLVRSAAWGCRSMSLAYEPASEPLHSQEEEDAEEVEEAVFLWLAAGADPAEEVIHKSMSLKYEPASAPLHISDPKAKTPGMQCNSYNGAAPGRVLPPALCFPPLAPPHLAPAHSSVPLPLAAVEQFLASLPSGDEAGGLGAGGLVGEGGASGLPLPGREWVAAQRRTGAP